MDVFLQKISLKAVLVFGFLGLAIAAPVEVQNTVDSDSMVSFMFFSLQPVHLLVYFIKLRFAYVSLSPKGITCT